MPRHMASSSNRSFATVGNLDKKDRGKMSTFKADLAAKRAGKFGGSVMLYRLNIGYWASGVDGPIKGVSEAVEAIERDGWRIEQVVYDGKQSSNGALLLLCRRVQPDPEPPAQPQPQPQQRQPEPQWQPQPGIGGLVQPQPQQQQHPQQRWW